MEARREGRAGDREDGDVLPRRGHEPPHARERREPPHRRAARHRAGVGLRPEREVLEDSRRAGAALPDLVPVPLLDQPVLGGRAARDG